MLLNDQTLIYQVGEIPDPADSRYKAVAGGDVRSAVFASGKHLLRQIAHMLPMSVAAEFLFVFDPKCKSYDRQSRLRQYLRIWASDSGMAKNMDLLIQRGELSRFYKFERVYKPLERPKSVSASCDIIRRQDFIEPLHNCEFNPKIPNYYNNIRKFTPNEKNDSPTLDRVLDGVTETAVISVRVQPADISHERRAITAVIEQYRSINHGRDFDNEDYAGIDYIGSDDHKYFSPHSQTGLHNFRDPLADDIGRSLREIHESLCHRPHLFFNIRITAETEAAARLVGGVFAEAAFEEGDYRLIVSKKGDKLFDKTVAASRRPEIAPLPVYRHLRSEEGVQDYDDLSRLVQLATVDELAGAFRLSVASSSSPLCMRRNTDPVYEDINNLIVFGYDEQGIEGNCNALPRGVLVNALCKHLAVLGVSGSAKTTFNFCLLCQLFKKGIPCMVIETAKKEYRALKKFRKHKNKCFRELAENLEVYTLGAEEYSPLRFNPLEILKGIGKDEHIDNLMGCFLAAMPTFPSLPGILSEALEEVYNSHPDPDWPPIIADLYAACLKVLSEKSYCGEVSSNIRAALEVRLGSLTRGTAGTIFNCRRSVPNISYLMSSFSIQEIDRLSDDHKCLIPLFLMSSLRENLKCMPPANGLRFVMLLEESHNIFGPSGEARPSEETPDPKAFVAKFITKMLAELRALGVGIILSDQHPTALDPSAVKSTSSKIAFRQVYGKDREELALSMLLSATEVEDLARLKPGEAFLYKEGYFRPIRIKTRNLHEELDLTELTDEQLLDNIKNDQWFQDMAIARVSTEMDQLKEHMDGFENERIAIIRHTIKLQECYKYILDQINDPKSKRRLLLIIRKASKLKKQLLSSYKVFCKGPYKMYSPALNCLNVDDAGTKACAADLSNRFESVIKKGTDSVYSKIEQLIKNCKTLMRKGG